MAEKQLYPVFEVPDFVTKKNEESRKQQYKPSVYFDYAYSTKYGAELEISLAQSDHASVEASLERTIIEAIMANPKTEYCRDFAFTWNGPDSCDCAFNIKGRGYDEIQTVNLNFSK